MKCNKNFKNLTIVFLVVILFIVTMPSHAEITSNGMLRLMANLGYSSTKLRNNGDDSDYLAVSGLTNFQYGINAKDTNVRAQLRMDILGSNTNGLVFDLARAYVRQRVVISPSYALQFEMGKNTISWGEGSVYNAGDVVFGAQPKTTSLAGTSDFRDFAFWQLRSLIPFNQFSYLELIMAIPDQTFSIATEGEFKGHILAPSTDIKETGAGLRTHLELSALQLEFGAYSRFLQEKVSPYLSLSLPLKIKLYVSSGMEIDYKSEDTKNFATQLEDKLFVSGGLLYIFGFANAKTLSLQLEALYGNYQTQIQLDTTLTLNRILSLSMRANTHIESQLSNMLLGSQWNIVDGFTSAVFTTLSLDFDDEQNSNLRNVGASVMFQYKF